MKVWDEIVVGVGAMGAALSYNLAKIRHQKNESVNVLALEQFELIHDKGSSGGESRATHLAIFEGPEYIPLIVRSNKIWRELERASGRKQGSLYVSTDGIVISTDDQLENKTGYIYLLKKISDEFNIPYEILSNEELRNRYPQFNVSENNIGFVDKSMGYLFSDECIKAQIELAEKYGTMFHENECYISHIKLANGLIKVKTNKSEYLSKKVFLTAGPWIKNLLDKKYSKMFTLYQKQFYWFEIEKNQTEQYRLNKLPLFFWDLGGSKFIYGFPNVDQNKDSFKLAIDQYAVLNNPEDVSKKNNFMGYQEVFKNYIQPNFVGVKNQCEKTKTCIYTLTQDSKFLIDYLPQSDQKVFVVSPCSGHGFKSSAAVGEILAQFVIEGQSEINLMGLFGGIY